MPREDNLLLLMEDCSTIVLRKRELHFFMNLSTVKGYIAEIVDRNGDYNNIFHRKNLDIDCTNKLRQG